MKAIIGIILIISSIILGLYLGLLVTFVRGLIYFLNFGI